VFAEAIHHTLHIDSARHHGGGGGGLCIASPASPRRLSSPCGALFAEPS